MSNELDNPQRLYRAMIAASERSHRDIAESVHDTLCQTLGGAGLMAKVLAAGMKGGQKVKSAQLDSLAETLDRALDEARHVLSQLQPVVPGQDGLMTALARLAAEKTTTQTSCSFECENAVLIDNQEASLSLYRVAEDAVKKALEDARANHIKIVLTEGDGTIALTVTDNGQAPASKVPGADVRGFEVMRSRAIAAGGTLTIASESGTGATVTFMLPESAVCV